MYLSELPHELILKIYRFLYDDNDNTQLKRDNRKRRLWSLELFSTCMVCQSWYTAGSEYLFRRISSLPHLSLDSLINTIEFPILTPTLPQYQHIWIDLFQESKRNNLEFHLQVRQLVLDLSCISDSSGTPLQLAWASEQSHSPTQMTLKSGWELELSAEVKGLFATCPNLETLEIIYDPQYTVNERSSQVLTMLSNILSSVLTMYGTDCQSITTKPIGTSLSSPRQSILLSHLVFTARESMERCPCCVGRGWDHVLLPLLQRLPTTKLELGHVLPSRSVLEFLSQSNKIDTLVIRGNILAQTSRFTRYGSTVVSPSRVPLKLISQLHTLEIYLHTPMDDQQQQQYNQKQNDISQYYEMELHLMIAFKQIYDIVEPIKSLQRLILRGHKRRSVPINNGTNNINNSNIDVALAVNDAIINKDTWNKMELLAGQEHLQCLILDNIPGFQCPIAQDKLRNIFMDAGKNNVVYIT
ncbi:hypothetical protein BC941DRAFT_510901 [Chlamydoabsidia padenii]|nr:hypothetical protein BC941DRAFT_510901 [Chlamydoabsidia padenii]